jgi:hypothetical protein
MVIVKIVNNKNVILQYMGVAGKAILLAGIYFVGGAVPLTLYGAYKLLDINNQVILRNLGIIANTVDNALS